MYIITGGAGFIGSAVAWRLNQEGVDDILIVDNLGTTDKWKNLAGLRYREYLHRDEFLRRIREGEAPDQVEAVIHMGACSSTTERDADFLMANNVRYAQEVCRYALARGARFIQASSAATYGDGSQGFSVDLPNLCRLRPLNMYGYSKHAFDVWASRENLLDRIVCLKFFNVYGPNEYHKGDMRSMVCKAVEQIRADGALRLFRSCKQKYADGGQMRDFVYVKDCAEIVRWLLGNPDVNGILNAGSGAARTWNDLAKAVFAAMALPVNVVYTDMPEALRGKYQNFTQADMAWIDRHHCPVRFHSLEDGVRDDVGNYLLADDPYLGA
jgi:ADP-L-glycero-D-manno-heptose 6-epimerase